MPRSVLLCDPDAEGASLAAVLRAAGFDVRQAELGALGEPGDVAVVAADQQGVGDALSGWLAGAGAGCPLVLVADWGEPAPRALSHITPLPRPVRHDALLVRVREALAGASAAQAPLRDALTAAPAVTADLPGTVVPLEPSPPAPEALPPPAHEPLEGASLSAALRAVLARATEETHTAALPPLLLEGQQDSAVRLAPDALLSTGRGRTLALEDEGELTPLELAVPAGDLPRAPRPPAPAPRRPSAPPQQAWLTIDDPALGTLSQDGASRGGALGPLGLAAVVWRIVELGLDAELRVGPLTLRFLAGELRDVVGDVHRRALRALGERPVDSEAAAKARLRERVGSGALSELARARAVRQAREHALAELLCAEDLDRFVLAPLPSAEQLRLSVARRSLSAPVRVLLARAARERLGDAALARFTAPERRLELPQQAVRRLEEAELEPELIELFERGSGKPVSRLLAEAAEADGVPGLLCLLASLGAVRFPA